jgi:hypothetical protein
MPDDADIHAGQDSQQGDIYRFGRSRQYFRGPKPDLDAPYLAILGGSDTYGKYVERPFPVLLGPELPVQAVNWGTPDAGPTFFLKDPVILEACSRAEACVITATDAFAVSNRLYTVQQRRNGRLDTVSKTLQTLYPRVDFSRFTHVRDMLAQLQKIGPGKFNVVELEIRDAWVARVRELLTAIEAPKLLFWMAGRQPDDPAPFEPAAISIGPAMVTGAMLDQLAPFADHVVTYSAPVESQMMSGTDRIFDDGEELFALRQPGGQMHREAAEVLYPYLRQMCGLRAERKAAARGIWQRLGLSFR